MVGTLVPAVNATEASPTAGALSNVLLDSGLGFSPHAGAKLLSGLNAIKGADVYPIYAALGAGPAAGPCAGPRGGPGRQGKGAGGGGPAGPRPAPHSAR